MARGNFSQRYLRVIFEVVFVLTQDNKTIDSLHQVAFFAEFFQVLAFCFHQSIPWKAPAIQSFMSYIIVPWSLKPLFWIFFALNIIMVACLAVVIYDIYVHAETSRLKTLKVVRWLMGGFATVLFFPVLDQYLHPFSFSIHGESPEFLYIISAAIMIPLFFIPNIVVYFFFFEPNPSSTGMFASSSARAECMISVMKSLVAVVFMFLPAKPAVVCFFLICLATLYVTAMYGAFYRSNSNSLACGFAMSHVVISIAAMGVTFNDTSDSTGLIVAIVMLVLCLPIALCTAVLFNRRVEYLHPRHAILNEKSNPWSSLFVSTQKVQQTEIHPIKKNYTRAAAHIHAVARGKSLRAYEEVSTSPLSPLSPLSPSDVTTTASTTVTPAPLIGHKTRSVFSLSKTWVRAHSNNIITGINNETDSQNGSDAVTLTDGSTRMLIPTESGIELTEGSTSSLAQTAAPLMDTVESNRVGFDESTVNSFLSDEPFSAPTAVTTSSLRQEENGSRVTFLQGTTHMDDITTDIQQQQQQQNKNRQKKRQTYKLQEKDIDEEEENEGREKVDDNNRFTDEDDGDYIEFDESYIDRFLFVGDVEMAAWLTLPRGCQKELKLDDEEESLFGRMTGTRTYSDDKHSDKFNNTNNAIDDINMREDMNEVRYSIARWIFERGIRKFPKSLRLRISYALFLVFVSKSGSDFAFAKRIVKKALQQRSKLWVDTLFSIFYITKKWEQSMSAVQTGEDVMNVLDMITFKNEMRKAKKHHKATLVALHRFWSLLASVTKKNMQVNTSMLSAAAQAVEKHEEEAVEYFQRLLIHFPKSPRVFRVYASFVSEVKGDETFAQRLLEIAENLEVEQSSKQSKTRRSIKRMSLDTDGMSDSDVYSGASRSETSSGALSLDLFSDNLLELNSSTQLEYNNIYEYGSSKDELTNKMTRGFAWTMNGVLCIFCCVVFGCLVTIYVLGQDILNSHVVNAAQVGQSGGTRKSSQEAVLLARQLEMSYNGLLTTPTATTVRSKLKTIASSIYSSAQVLYTSPYLNDDRMKQRWNTEDISVTVSLSATQQKSTEIVSIWDMYNAYTRHLYKLAETTTGNLTVNDSFRFVVDNGPQTLLNSIWKLVIAYQNAYTEDVSSKNTLLIMMAVVSLSLPFILTLVLFLPAYRRIEREHRSATDLFLSVPVDSIERMVNKLSEKLSPGSAIENLDDAQAFNEAFQKAQQQQTQQQQQQQQDMNTNKKCKTNRTEATTDNVTVEIQTATEVYEKEEKLEKEDKSETGEDAQLVQKSSTVGGLNNGKVSTKKETKQLHKIVLVYAMSILLIVGLLSAMLAILFTTNNTFGARPITINYAGSRRSYTYGLYVLATELIRQDGSTWSDLDDIRNLMRLEIDIVSNIHRGVKYGNSTLGLQPSMGTSAAQDTLLFQPTCSNNTVSCMSLDSQFSYFLADCRSLVELPNSMLNFNLSYYKNIASMQNGAFATLLDQSKSLYLAEANPIVDQAKQNLSIVLAVACPVFILAFLLLRSPLVELRNTIRRTRKMIMMLPQEELRKIDCLAVYVTNEFT